MRVALISICVIGVKETNGLRGLEAYLTWFLPIETEAYVRESIAKTYERGAQRADFDPEFPKGE